jgi:hypothetical protein
MGKTGNPGPAESPQTGRNAISLHFFRMRPTETVFIMVQNIVAKTNRRTGEHPGRVVGIAGAFCRPEIVVG